VSAQPPDADQPHVPDRATIRCPRCSAPIGPDQDWCLECGAPARTRLAPTPNWQLPTVAIGAIVAIAGALLAFAFVKLTNDNGTTPVGTTPSAVVATTQSTAAVPPAAAATTTAPVATTTAPTGAPVPSTVPGQTTPHAATQTQTSTTATQPPTTGTTSTAPTRR
jgi:hypothetical protein